MEKPLIVVGIDDNDHSFYALNWTLQHLFSSGSENSAFKIVLVHAKPFAVDVVRLAGPATAEMLSIVAKNLEVVASTVMERAENLCKAKSVNDAIFEVIEGNSRSVLCEAVEKHHASMLIVGSHGYGVLKRVVLGSVSDYCAHHAHCPVMIVKMPPKIKV
ncbi:universal stress protein PHOS32-like [Andrographis paniculata]|uniref:universal stress protein PHOS32-like n=1 Tax=Andrographis paniculata TaxID=175694 RepID=UPI0021E75CD8|nr:universal stress protein PHOS32-like [Andrographis paniculata]